VCPDWAPLGLLVSSYDEAFYTKIYDWGEMMGAKENDDSGKQKGSPKAHSSGVGT